MEIERQVDEAVYLLRGLENGTMAASDLHHRLKDYDPVMIYFMTRYLREKYPASNQAAQGVLARLLDLTSTYPDLVAKAQKGERDVLREWFDENYSMKEFFNDPEKYFSLIVEKLEG